MDMTYRVSKNAYIELLADMVRRNDSRPVKLFTTFLLTLGQMAAVAVLCATRLEGRCCSPALRCCAAERCASAQRARCSVWNTQVSSRRITGASTGCAPQETSCASATAASAFPARFMR